MVSRDVYPIPKPGDKEPRYADYGRWLADFIRDVRKDLAAPKMPFVIGVMGVGGGIVKVPLMNLVMGVPLRVATATSTASPAA